MSPILFGIYYDELLCKLKNSGLGCKIGNVFAGAFAYADDATLLCPSKQGINKMLLKANEFSNEYNIAFNPCKSNLLFYTKNGTEESNITFNGSVICNKMKTEHLGNPLGSQANYLCTQKSINDIYVKTNLLMTQFKHCTEDVRYKLF